LGIENSDRTKWNNENYEALKKTLDQLIPLIRFMDISPANFYDKVRPYKAIIPHHFYESVTELYYNNSLPKTAISSSRVRIESKIIKPKLATIIANWIDINDSTILSHNNKYKFGLVCSMTRDELDYVTFYSNVLGRDHL
jgi:hypothetical protein